MGQEDAYFEVESKLRVKISITKSRWNKIVKIKHPEVEGSEENIKRTLENPNEIRLSKKDSSVYLYYRLFGKLFLCTIAKHNNGEVFIITAYYADRIKEGEAIWRK